MAYVFAILAGLTGAALGWVAAGLAANAIFQAIGLPLTANALPDSVLHQLGAIAGFVLAAAVVLRVSCRANSFRDGACSSAVIATALAVIFAAGFNLRLGAMEHLGLDAGARSIEFEIRLPPVVAAGSSKREAQVELRTDLNERIADLRGADWSAADGGRAILKGFVPIEFRTTNRTLVLNLPGQPQRLFKVRLSANPSRSTEFGPWHQVDQIANSKGDRETISPSEGFAIRYRAI